jgi:deoxyribodipyrimidine photo-lyase
MKKRHKKSLFIFRRDLRLYDNIGLMEACKQSDTVILCFVFTPEQIQSNAYRSDFSLQFMIESLEDLYQEIKVKKGKLFFFFGHQEEIVEKCISELHVDGVFANRDYTPYSQKRDQKIKKVCQKHKIDFQLFDDALLQAPEEVLKDDGKPYSVFTPYFRKKEKIKVLGPKKNTYDNFFSGSISFSKDKKIFSKILPKREPNFLRGGRKEGQKILSKIKEFSHYESSRDIPAKATTHLSAYLKFNVLSIREVYYTIFLKFGKHHELIRALCWRDFFTTIAFFFPKVFTESFYAKFNKLPWKYDRKLFQKWCEGKTGFPIVDAGMRELNQTGFMHNRIRMITASFLVKDLHIDWRWGEKYFAQKLIDYDPSVNNGNWQWVASTGCDAQPYFRVFNPWNQQKKIDPDCIYIKKWIPELRTLSSKEIHNLEKTQSEDYFTPIANHAKESQKAIKIFRSQK